MDAAMWDSEAWLRELHDAKEAEDFDTMKELRVEVFWSTVETVKDRGYTLDRTRIELDADGEYDALHGGTVFCKSTDHLTVPVDLRGRFGTEVRVRNADTLEEALAHCNGDEVPAVLNMASWRNPGGGVTGGSGAQEENLFRRSNLLWSLYQFKDYAHQYGITRNPEGYTYPITRQGGIYSPPAWVFRSSEPTGYDLLAEPYQVAFLTVPAISWPDTIEVNGETRLTPEAEETTRAKIRAILRLGAVHGHVDLVLGAFGCGAYRNPPEHVAELFRDILAEDEFSGVFRLVVFAILDDHNAMRHRERRGNYQPFKDILDPE